MEKGLIILKLENVTKEFMVEKNKKLRAVNNVSFEVHQGECVAIVGESGCGKSTVAKMVTHIEKVTDGKIYFKGEDVVNYKEKQLREMRRKMQMVFQNPYSVFSPRMKIGKFLCEPLINYKLKNKREALEEAEKLLKRVELNSGYMEKFPHQLSGGELQRVVIARALALKPELLVCDEVTSALDVSIQEQIIKLLLKLQREENISNLFISHDLALVQNFSDKVIVMYLGNIVETMESRRLYSEAKHPYTKALIKSNFKVHDDKRENIEILNGEPPSPLDLPKGCPFSTRCNCSASVCFETKATLSEIEEGHLVACHMV